MVKSRKYAIVTAALALILVAAVVLTVVLVGNGSFYTPEQDGIASNAAVTVGSSVGTVDSDYTYNTLVAHSQKKNSEWDESDLQDLRDGSGNSGTDGVAETYVTTLDKDFFLITQAGWTSVDKGEVPGGGSGYYELQYNGVWYRFLNGNESSSINTSLYQSYSDFMGNTAFYRSSSAYGLMVTDISYNPNSFATNQYFNATLDGNGKTLSATALLNLTTTSYTLAMSPQDFGYNVSKDNGGRDRMDGTVFTGMVFGSLKNGTFKNFQWTDANSGSGTHVSKHTPVKQGTAFGGLVGYAGSDTIGGDATSYVNNISLVFNHSVQHISDSNNYNAWDHSRAATYTGGLIGINYSANIELARVRLGNGVTIEQQTYAVTLPTSWQRPDIAFGCFGGIVGIQMGNRTFSKVIVSGADATAALYGHHCSTEHGDPWVPVYNTTEERMGCVIGAMGSGCTITLNGVILDMNYSECYAWLDRGKRLYRGMMVGEALGGASAITYKDIYITDMVFAGSFEGNTPGPGDVGGGDFRPITTHYDGAYTAQYWFYGNSANVRAFAYLDDDVVKDVSFSDDADKMLQITAPDKNTGVMWNVTYTYTASDGSVVTTLDEDVFTQNSRENVQVSAWTTEKYKDTSKFVKMTIEYASSYTFDVTNGPNGDNTGNKYYDGKQVNFPALSLNIPDSDYIMSTGTKYTDNGYITITENGSGGYTLNFNNGSAAVGEAISYLFNASGTQFSKDFGNIIAAVLQLEAMQNEEYGIIGMDSWNTQTNVNTYRWSSLGMFAMQDSSGNRYVFAPSASPTLTTMQITQRPIYVSVNDDNKNVPYIGNSYNVASGTSAQAGNVFFSFGTTAEDGEDAIISGDEVLLQDITLTRDNSAVSLAQDAGTYAINATTLEGGARNNYTLVAGPSGANTFVIDKAQVTLTVTGGSATYGFTKPANAAEFMQMVNLSFASSNSSLTGFASRDNITVNMNIQTGDTSTSAGQWLITPMLGGGSVFAFNFPAGEYTVEYEGLSGSGINNYEIVGFENSTPFVVNKARLAANLPSIDDFVYGDSPVVGTPSYAGLLDVDSVSDYTISYFSGSDAYSEANFVAGSYTARAVVTAIDAPGSAAGINNYDVQYNTSAFEVSKRDTTVQFNFDPSKTYSYKGEAYTFTATALGNPAFSDTADGVTFQAYSDVNRETAVEALNAGTYYAGAVSDTLSANYNVTGITDMNGAAWENFVIGRATVTLSNTGITNATYSGAPISYDPSLITINYGDVPGLADEIDDLKAALTYAYNGSSSAPVNAGTYNVTVSLPQQQNFDAASLTISGGLVIGQLAITITPDKGTTVTVTYNGVMIPDLTYTVKANGEPIEEQLEITTKYYKDSVEAGNITSDLRNVGAYIIEYSYDGATGNYASTSTQVTYTVTQKSLTLTLNNANVTYNKEAFSPDYTVEGLITGDNAEITYTVQKDGEAHDGDVINAGTYEFTFSAGNGNYIISEESAAQTVVITPYDLTAQALNTTVFFNSGKTPEYYENQLNVRVLDADGTDITKNLSITKDLIVSTIDDTSVTVVGERGGNYAVKVTIASLPGGYNANNYTLQESIYAVFIYRIALGGKLTGGTDADSVTYGTGFDIKGVLTAMADDKTQELTVNSDGAVEGIEGSDLTDVTSITISSATFAVNGVTLAMTDNVVNLPSVTTDVNTIFNIGVFDKGFANAGTYKATITITLAVTYKDSGQNRSVTISAPFTWTVDPYEIQVTAGQLDKYYTEAITTSDVLGVVEVGDQYKGYITAVSSVIGGTSSTFVNAGNYTYDVVLNTGAAGYYNYTLPEVSTGKIVVSPLILVVTVGNLSVQYGEAIAPTATAQLFRGDEPYTNESIASQYSWTTSSSVSAGTGVGSYEDALTATVTATDNFEVKTDAGNLEITKRMLGIALNDVTMAYSTGEIDVTYRITSGSLFGDDKQPVLVNFEITADGNVADLDRLAVGGYDLNVNVQGEAFDNSNYGTESVANGTLTVTPFEITSVTWNAPEQLVYKGAAFESGELYTVENFENDNGDVVTFSVSYGEDVVVMNAGSYSARVAVASVTNGADPVDAGNYSVANVAAQPFSVAKANLAVSNIRGFANENGVLTVSGTYNTQSQAIATDEIKFSFGDGIAYDSALHGAITVSVGHSDSGIPTDPVNAGSYDVTVSVSGAENFNNATISGITLVIDKWILTEKEAAENFVISFDESYVYDSQEHGATLAFQGTLANFAAPYTFTYYLQASDGSLSQASPVNAGTYLISLTVGNDNYEYTTAEGSNEGSIVVTPTDRIQLSFTVPTSEGLPQNNVYYTGSPIVPEMSATITVTGSAERVTSSDAFTFKFYVATTADDPNAIDLSTVPGMGSLPSGTYYYSDEVSEAVRPSSYYIVATFNSDGTYSNYKTGYQQLYVVGGVPTAMVITFGAMSVRVVSGLTRSYDGTIGFNGHDVIYSDADGLYWINTDIVQFTGVDLTGMDNLTEDLKVGDITVSVYFLYERTVQDGATVERKTKLYDWNWQFDSDADERLDPKKTVYSEAVMDGGVQIQGPMNGITDFGYANGIQTAEYVVEVSIDNTDSDYYSSAVEITIGEDGQPDEQRVPHSASGYAYIEPADIQFEMFYTNDFYNDATNMVAEATGGYRELNDSVEDSVELQVLTADQIREISHYLMRGVALSVDENYDWLSGVTRTKYAMDEGGALYNYEVLAAQYINVTIKNSAGQTVYTYIDGVHTSQNGGVTNAGTYTIKFEFSGISGKYMPFTYTGTFVQQKAEYHITVTQKEGANLTTEFGVEFDVSDIADQLEVKVELGDGGYTTATGKYTAFENAVAQSGGDMSTLDSYIRLVGTEDGISTEYNTNTYKSNVGSYFIYYVYTSVDSNLEIVMETESSMIEVTKTAPSFMVNAEGERVDEKEGLDLGSQSYTPNTSWNDDVIRSVGLGIEYKSLEGLTGEYYTTKNVTIATIEYSADGDVWTNVEIIGSVGKYRVTIAAAGEGTENAEANLEGTLGGVYVFFEVTRISAQANVVVTGSDLVWSDEAGAYIATFNGNTHAIGYSVTAGGNAVSDSSLQGTVNILIAFTENAADGDYVDINTSPIVGAGSYWVKVTVTGSENYDVTPSDAVKITINKADPTIRFKQSEYNMTYSLKGNTIPAGDYSFELDGRNPAPDITAENSSVYYLSAPISGSGDVAGAQAQVAAMVNAFIASSAEDIVEWLKQNEGTYPGYKFTSVGETPAATDVGYYFPVVIFNGDDNYNRSGALVANVPHPVITVAKATLVLAVTIVDDMYVVYGSAPGEDISDTKEIGKYVSMDWSYTDADGGVVTVDSGIFGQIVSGFTYRLINCNQYVQGTAVGTVPNAYLFVVDSFESTNFRYTYDQGGYVNIQVTPATVAFDVSKGSVSLESDIADQAPVALTADGYTFNRVYSGGSFGPLKFDYSGEIGLDVNGDNAKKLDDRGFGDYGIFTVSASGGYTQEAVSAAGSYTGSITITLNNTNYVVEGMEEGTLTLPVNLVIDKAIIQISFDYLTYAAFDGNTYTEKSSAGEGEHHGWYEYATIYTGANFDYNNRVYVTSYRYGENGELEAYGAYSDGKRLGEVGGITESDGASGNLAAPGEYNIHLMLDQLATNYKFIDSAGNTVGQAADGSQADLSSLDINVTISPSKFVETGNSLAAGEKPLFDYADGVYSREFDGTDLTAAFLKTFLSVVPYKLSNTAGTLQGSIAAPNSQVQLTVDRDYAAELIGNNLIVELLSGGAAVDSAMYAGDYTLRVRLNNNAYSMEDMQFTLKITPASKIDASVSVKGQTARMYNGLDIVPNITLTLTVTDYNGNKHTISVPSYTANVYKQVDGTTPDTPTFSYDVVNGDVNTAAINGKFTDAGTYIVRLVISNPNVSVNELRGEKYDRTYTINARSLTDGSIRSTYEKLFSYRTTVNSGGEVVPVAVSAEDLKVLITYNRTTNLVLGEDFTIDFGTTGAGKYTGNYTFTINGTGNFTGTIAGSYSIGASVGIVSAPDAITYGDDSVTVKLNINSLGSNSLAGDLTLNFSTGSSSRIVDANDNTVAQLGVPSEIVISANEVSGNEFDVVFTGLGAVNAGEYFLDLVFSCTYAGITTEGTISREVSGETASKVVVDEADVVAAAAGVTATVTAVNSTTVSFNISGLPSAYEYSVDGGETWIKANKGSNTISGLTAGTAFNVLLRINDVNYASSENVHEYPLASALSFTTTASVDDIIASAESLANNFNATGFARYAQLLQNVASVSSGDLAARGDEIEEALAAVEEARAEYIEDLQAAIDSAVGAAEKAAGKASGVSGAATAGLVAGGVAMPVLGIGLIFAAARKRKSKEEDLND